MATVAPSGVLRLEGETNETLLLKGEGTRQTPKSPTDTKTVTLKISPFETSPSTGSHPFQSTTVLNTTNRSQVLTLEESTKGVSLNATAKPGGENNDASSVLPTAYVQPYFDLLQNHELFKDVQQFLFDAATAAEDRTSLTNDVIDNPGKYTPRERLLVYLDLLKSKATFDKFIEKRRELGKQINNETEVRWAFQNGLDVLGKDPEVQSLLTEKTFKAVRLMFSGQILVMPPEGLSGPEQMNWQLEKFAKIDALKKEVMEGFQRDVVDGGILDDGIRTGEDIATIFQQYNAALGFYSMVLPEDVLKANVDIAKKKYAEFFKDHVLPNLPDAREALDKLIEAAAGGLSEQEKQGVGSFIPIVDAKLLTSGGAVFGDFNIDLDSLRDAARRDFYYKDGDGLSRLFDPALEAMAKNTFGDGADKAKERAQFKADVMARLEPLLDKIAAGEVGLRDLAGNVERLIAGLSHPTGGDAWGYRHAVATALDGLVHAANFVSKMPANPDWNMERGIRDGTAPKSHLHTHSVNDVMTMIALATGLAGQGIASGGGDSRFFLGSAGEAGIAKKMFGTENKGWSKTLARLQLDYMDKSLLDESLSKTSKLVTEQVRKDLPHASVIAPVSVTTEGLKKMLAPSLNALAETLFKDNAEAAEQYKTNITTIYTALWGLLRPGGNADTLVTQVRQLVDKTVTSAPSGVDQLKYKESVVQGVMSILQATRAIYNDRNATSQNWDTIGITVLHSMAGLSAIGKALGSALIADMPSTLPPLLVGEDFPISAREQLGKFFKGTGIAIGSLAAIGWMPVEYFQLVKAYKDGNSDAGDLAFMTVGVVADTIGAAEATFGLAELLINSAFVGRTGAQVTMLPLAFSTGFTVASIVSWLAWAGLVAYQTAKQQKETDKFVDRMNDDLQRLTGIKADIYNF